MERTLTQKTDWLCDNCIFCEGNHVIKKSAFNTVTNGYTGLDVFEYEIICIARSFSGCVRSKTFICDDFVSKVV